jgi:transposase-like protein
MAKTEDEAVMLLRQLVAIELYRAGLSKADIRARLGIAMNVLNEMLKGVSREVTVRVTHAD